MERQHLRFSVWIFLLLLSSSCFGQTIRVHVVNAENRSPLKGQQVLLSLPYEKNEKAPAKFDNPLKAETDVNGIAEFALQVPPPAHLSIQVHLTSVYWQCGCMEFVVTQDFLRKGIVGISPDHESETSATPLKAEPGEIIFLARPLTSFERLLHPLVKE